jgi:hypothetical protein
MRKAATITKELNKAAIALDATHRAVFALVQRTDVRFDAIVAMPQFKDGATVKAYYAQLEVVHNLRHELRFAN